MNVEDYYSVKTTGDAKGEAERAREVYEVTGTTDPTKEDLERCFPVVVERFATDSDPDLSKRPVILS